VTGPALELAARAARRDAIVAAAAEQFARHGFRGASLREIACQAGVSLALLNHHFGSKSDLLSAVLACHRSTLRELAEASTRVRHDGALVLDAAGLARAWTAIAFETAARPDGLRFLRFVARMADDAAEEATVVRRQLAEPAAAFVGTLQQCCPGMSRSAATAAYLCMSASLLKIATRAPAADDPDLPVSPASRTLERARVERFLVAGLEATVAMARFEASLQDAEPRPPHGPGVAHS